MGRLVVFAALAMAVVLAPLPARPVSAQTVPTSRAQVSTSFAPVVRQAAPAVVNIYSRRVVKTSKNVSPLLDDPLFRYFFGEQFGLGVPKERVQSSLGSGVIIRSDGVVVTNHHVIKDSDEVIVVLADRREFEAKVVGTDERTDLAVVRIDTHGEKLPALILGNSDELEVGDLVLAIGNPFGVGQTVTSGIVSALARTSVGVSDYRFFIQTDAAINPGNSGGALVTVDGRLAGINSAIYSRSGGNIGIGFAIPANMVKAVVDGVLAQGRPVRPWLGASGQAVTPEIAESLGLARPVGVLVNAVRRGGPADTAGLRKGDVILAVNSHEVEDPEALRYRIATLPVGETATLKVQRAGEARGIAVRLVAPPDQPPRELTDIKGRNPFAGATVANVNPALTEELGLGAIEGGVIVTRVRRDSLADRINLRPGDVVLDINGRTIATVAELKQSLVDADKGWRIMVRRGESVLTVAVGG
ncbi:MAG: DegQ family serine endoprotease [Alphaproteobacteria bacterium]